MENVELVEIICVCFVA